MEDTLVFVALILVGLSAGLFVGWSVSVIPGTRRTGDSAYIETMQRINVAIVNPLFLIIFLGPAVALIAAAIGLFAGDQTRRAWLVVAAAVTYAVGMLGVTIGGNIPLNNTLDEFDLDGSRPEARKEQRVAYESRWNRWHYVRSMAGLISFCLVGAAALDAEA